MGGLLAEFDGLEVSKILYRALVLSFGDFRRVRCWILFLSEENQTNQLSRIPMLTTCQLIQNN